MREEEEACCRWDLGTSDHRRGEKDLLKAPPRRRTSLEESTDNGEMEASIRVKGDTDAPPRTPLRKASLSDSNITVEQLMLELGASCDSILGESASTGLGGSSSTSYEAMLESFRAFVDQKNESSSDFSMPALSVASTKR